MIPKEEDKAFNNGPYSREKSLMQKTKYFADASLFLKLS